MEETLRYLDSINFTINGSKLYFNTCKDVHTIIVNSRFGNNALYTAKCFFNIYSVYVVAM